MKAALNDSQFVDSKEVASLAYEHLRDLAELFLRTERADHTLQPTALAHEAWLRLVQTNKIVWRDEKHFLAFAATTLRRILIDHARTRDRQKRPSGRVMLNLDSKFKTGSASGHDVLDVNDALEELSELNPRQARVVELRFFAGLSIAEIADVMELSTRTVDGCWSMARAWLAERLEGFAA